MNKRYLHHLWTRIRPIKPWYLFAAFGVCALLCVVGLRSNYATMVRLREAVYQADRDGTNVEGALQQLRTHVHGHMNTNLSGGAGTVYPPIQLKETYARLQQAEQERANASNAQLYTDAQAYCERLYPGSFSGGPRVPCIEQYVKDRGGGGVKTIPDALYKFDFISPRWSPDLAGWSMVLAALFFVLALVRYALGRWFKTVL